MNNQRLDSIIREHADTIHDGRPGYWQFDYYGHTLIVLTDENHNRMRIISPAFPVGEMNEELAMVCLSANFDRALDARYAISGDFVWSAFIHPLQQLDVSSFVDAMTQVATLAATFGTSFNSSGLSFGGGEDDAAEGDGDATETAG